MKKYADWVIGTALPVWATKGFDAAAGRFHERLDSSARPLAVPQRAMVQARQIYVFAHAAALGWFPDGGALAEQAMTSLRRDFGDDGARSASFAFSIAAGSGQVVSDVRDAYTHAFVLFAIARLYDLNGDTALLTLADRTIAFIDDRLVDRMHGGVHDVYPIVATEKRQNPQMHLLEAYLALETVAPERGYLARAETLVQLFADRMFHAGHGVLLEHFSHSWGDHPDPSRNDVFEPGHHYEWIWLLYQYEKLSGRDLGASRFDLGLNADRHGLSDRGLIYDELNSTKRVTKTSHRVWPHTEAIKAAGTRHVAGDPDALPFARRMAATLAEHFLDKPFPGGWTDHIDRNHAPLVDYVPASSLYHLFLAAAEADSLFR